MVFIESSIFTVTMDKKLFERLVDSMQQHEAIRRGERAPSLEFFVDAEKVKEIKRDPKSVLKALAA